ncbi:MAG: efflux RND transporter permease subunit, partial [Pseudomonadota bacterium]
AKDRGLIPAIVDGVCDRLRPVMLTTLTTVLGLMPLLYEGSNQAEFLKPTVITLVYGLGVGMVLVLLVVPALMAMQQDVGDQVRAYRRAAALARKRPSAAVPQALATLLIAVGFVVTLGWTLVTGGMPAPLAAMSPVGGLGGALALFAAIVVVVVLAALIIGWIAMALASKGRGGKARAA